jgi:hypothetical protein
VPEVAAEPVAERPRRDRREAIRNDNATRGHRPANDDDRQRRQRGRRDHDDGPTPVGFGDEVPAFMMIGAKG